MDPGPVGPAAGTRKTRILLLITGLGLGGAEKAVWTLATRLDRSRHDVRVACLLDRGPYAERLERAGVPVHPLGMRHKLDARALFRLRRLLREHVPDVLHTFLFHANLAGRLIGAWAGVPVRISSVRVCETRRPSHLSWDRRTIRLVHAETCVCEAVRRFTIERARIPAEKLVVIPNGIEAEDVPSGTRERVRAAEGVAGEEAVILSLGRLDEQKAPEELVRAAARLEQRGTRFRMWIAGTGPAEAALRAEIARAGLEGSVRLLGARTDVAGLLAAADVFALASRWEGLPNAVLEAMAAGRPVVATSVGGTPELVVEGETGTMCPTGDAEALAERLARLANDPGLRRRWGEAGRARALRDFPVARFIAAHEELYRRWLPAAAPARGNR